MEHTTPPRTTRDRNVHSLAFSVCSVEAIKALKNKHHKQGKTDAVHLPRL